MWAIIKLAETKAILLDALEPEIMDVYFGVKQKQQENSNSGNSVN